MQAAPPSQGTPQVWPGLVYLVWGTPLAPGAHSMQSHPLEFLDRMHSSGLYSRCEFQKLDFQNKAIVNDHVLLDNKELLRQLIMLLGKMLPSANEVAFQACLANSAFPVKNELC